MPIQIEATVRCHKCGRYLSSNEYYFLRNICSDCNQRDIEQSCGIVRKDSCKDCKTKGKLC